MQTSVSSNGTKPLTNRELTTKTKGLLVVLPFAAECIRRGAIVSEPMGDDARYDLVIDNGNKLCRVQVKTACRVNGSENRYSFGGRRRNNFYGRKGSRVTPYDASEVDYIVTAVKGQWYIYHEPHRLNNNGYINVAKQNPARDNWQALGLPEQIVSQRHEV